ncbi:hypothetical protein MMC21_005882 [Puttea exsequens]|nr:hypothetical protein [Puttea exsequens]
MAFERQRLPFNGQDIPTAVPKYSYTKCALGANEIRLLELLPGDPCATIRIKLHHYDLEEVPFYAALSYEWGNPSHCSPILVDNVNFSVTVNLERALRSIRTYQHPLLWIDAISINQNDEEEKNTHISKMENIFHRADSVIAWLGYGGNGSDTVMGLLSDIEYSRRPAQVKIRKPWTPSRADLREYEDDIRAFVNRSYWRRVWVIQEIALGSRALVLCGRSSTTWEAMDVLLSAIDRHNLLEGDHGLDHLRNLSRSRSNVAQTKPIGLLQALYDSHASLATDPRDRVYALLGLAFDRDSYVKSPHYGWTEEMICQDITQTVIWAKRSLDIIFIGSDDPKSKLPSWCPNYLRCREGSVARSLLSYLSGQDERYRAGFKGVHWRATNHSMVTRDAVKLVDHRYLVIRGAFLAEIDSLGCTLSDSSTVPTVYYHESQVPTEKDGKELFAAINRCLALYDSTYLLDPVNETSSCALIYYHLFEFDNDDSVDFRQRAQMAKQNHKLRRWRTRNSGVMIKGKTFRDRAEGFKASINSGEIIQSMKRHATRVLPHILTVLSKSLTGAKVEESNIEDITSAFSGPKMLPAELDVALENLAALIDEGLRLMTTDEDHVGWAHPDARLGDEVYLLTGCSMPAILRPIKFGYKTMYRMIGHAYVDGVMNGEVWPKLDQSDMQNIWLI